MPSRIVETLREGDGATFPKTGDKVLVHYTGCIASTGSAFDSSRARGHAFTFILGVGKVIPGWDQLVPQLSVGSRVRVHIPSEDGYGPKGSPPAVPPSTDLLFDIEVLAINETLVQEGIRFRAETEEIERAAADEAQAAARAKAVRERTLAAARGPKRSHSSDSDSSSSSSSSESRRERKRRRREKKERKKEKKARKGEKKHKKSKKKKDKHKDKRPG